MKKNSYLLMVLCVVLGLYGNVFGQASSYTMTPSIGAFTPVTGGTTVPALEADFAISGTITIPFNFVFEGTTYTSLRAASDGWISFNTSATATGTNDLDFTAANRRPLLAPLWDDLDGNAATPNDSKFEYVTTGVAPNRIMTLEWLNWEWNWNAGSAVISFQVKLYESTNEIEFVYRQDGATPSGASASIGLSGVSTFLSVQNTTTSPPVSSAFEASSINSRPATGQIYKFSPPTCPAPTNLEQVSATGTTIDLSWVTGGATDWQVDYGPVGHIAGTGTVVTTATASASLSSLTAMTCYDVFVRDSCAPGDVSNWVGPIQMCTAWMAPFLENYDNNIATSLFTADQTFYAYSNGWSAISNSAGSIWNWLPDNNNTGSGGGPGQDHTTGSGIFMFAENSGGAFGDSAWLYSPFVDLSNVTNPTIRMWYHKQGGASIADIIVEADTNGPGGWFVLDDTTMIGATHTGFASVDPWDELLIPLPNYPNTARFRITQIKQSCCDDGAIDDFEIFDLLDNDAKVATLDEPLDGGCAGPKAVVITIQNNGKDPITSLNVGYQVDGGTPVTETITASIPSFTSYTHTFSSQPTFAAGNAVVATWTDLTGDGFSGNDMLYDTIVVAPVISSYFYCEGFENGNGGWTTGGEANSWEIGVPSGTFVSAAANGTMAAATSLTGNYNNSENSYLLSPCFDFSSFENDPVLQFSHIFDIESCCDENWVEMSTNGGASWSKVGQSGSGTNWYNDAGNQWWDGSSGSSGVWRDASIELTGAAGSSDVKIRFFFSTDGSVVRDGVGIDDIAIVVPANDLFLDTVSTCNDPNFELDAGGIYPDTVVTYLWSTGDTTAKINVTTPGTYTVTITDTKIGVVSTESVEVIAQAAPSVTFASPVDTIDLNGLAAVIPLTPALPQSYTYKWTGPDGVSNLWFYVADPQVLGPGLHTITAEVTDNLGCTGVGQHAVFVSAWVGVNTLGESRVGYYPNPASDKITIQLNGKNPLGQLNVSIVDNQGRAVYKTQLEDNTGSLQRTIDVSGLASGMYFIRLESESGAANMKVVIE